MSRGDRNSRIKCNLYVNPKKDFNVFLQDFYDVRKES